MKLLYNIFCTAICLLGMVFISCQQEMEPIPTQGGLHVVLENVSTHIGTRSTPGELGKPDISDFTLNVERSDNGVQVYNKKLTDEVIALPTGNYNLTASYGENPIVAPDAPYYVGTAMAEIRDKETSEVSMTCKVANALVSVRFGRDEAEHARFDHFYQSYALLVHVAGYYGSILNTSPETSIYFRAGSSVSLEFRGKLKVDGREVSTMLETPKEGTFPATFAAAEHAIVTLTLPDPESATVVDITKVDLVEATMEENIPISWLPIPQATPAHQYDANGDLVGTDITFSNSYPGMKWKAVVTDDSGTEYRTIEGTGDLQSTYADNASGWPYIPAGNYTATYYLMQDDREPMKTGSRDFTVGNPDLHVTIKGGYTSYDKYLAGDIAAANACDAGTVYAPSYSLNVSSPLLQNNNYQHTVNTTFDGAQKSASQTQNSANMPEQKNIAARANAYKWQVDVQFDKTSISASKDFYITGLPASYAPPKGDQGWKFTSGGNCSFESTYMKLATTVAPTPKAQSPSYHCPSDVNVRVTTSASQNTGIFNYKYTLHFVGSGSNVENTTQRGDAKTFANEGTLKSGEDHLVTEYSYIAAGNYLQIYSLKVEYR